MGYDGEEFQNLDDVPIAKIARDEVFKAAVNTSNAWKDNMDEQGYRNTGEAIDSIGIEPQMEGANEYKVGSEKIQVLIGEYGRAPGSFPPPDAIADWVHEQDDMISRGETETRVVDGEEQTFTFDTVVYLVSKSIAENGLPAYRFGTRAFNEVSQELEAELEERFADEWDE